MLVLVVTGGGANRSGWRDVGAAAVEGVSVSVVGVEDACGVNDAAVVAVIVDGVVVNAAAVVTVVVEARGQRGASDVLSVVEVESVHWILGRKRVPHRISAF